MMNTLEMRLLVKRVPILDVDVSAIVLRDLLSWIESRLTSSRTSLVVGHNLHSTYLYHINPGFRSTYIKASLVLCDGFPIAFLASRVTGIRTSELRLGSTDWIPKLSQVSGISRVAVVGAVKDSNRAFCEYLAEKLDKGVIIESWSGENWNEEKANRVVSEVLKFNPNLTLVGLGMPLQEKFIGLPPKGIPGVVALVGGAIDQLSGYQKNAPRILGRLGLEWIWRLLSQPRRLFFRYLMEPWLLAAILVRKKVQNVRKQAK